MSPLVFPDRLFSLLAFGLLDAVGIGMKVVIGNFMEMVVD